MTSTGTYAFSPSAADVVQNAYRKIQISRADLTTEHLQDAAMESNFTAIDISNRAPNMWTREVIPQSVTAGIATYTLPARTILTPVVMLATTDAGGNTIERMLGAISGSDYATYPNKALKGPPSSFWFALASPPTITLYPTPDDAQDYQLRITSFRQLQDVDLSNGYSLDSPYRFLDAFSTGLASRLAQIYRPEMADKLNALYELRFQRAAATDQENVPFSVLPGLQSYFS